MVVLSIVILVFGAVLCFFSSTAGHTLQGPSHFFPSLEMENQRLKSQLTLGLLPNMPLPCGDWFMKKILPLHWSLGASLQLLKWKNKKTISWNGIQPPATASWTTTIQIYDICPWTSIYKWKNTSPLLIKESHQFPVIFHHPQPSFRRRPSLCKVILKRVCFRSKGKHFMSKIGLVACAKSPIYTVLVLDDSTPVVGLFNDSVAICRFSPSPKFSTSIIWCGFSTKSSAMFS